MAEVGSSHGCQGQKDGPVYSLSLQIWGAIGHLSVPSISFGVNDLGEAATSSTKSILNPGLSIFFQIFEGLILKHHIWCTAVEINSIRSWLNLHGDQFFLGNFLKFQGHKENANPPAVLLIEALCVIFWDESCSNAVSFGVVLCQKGPTRRVTSLMMTSMYFRTVLKGQGCYSRVEVWSGICWGPCLFELYFSLDWDWETTKPVQVFQEQGLFRLNYCQTFCWSQFVLEGVNRPCTEIFWSNLQITDFHTATNGKSTASVAAPLGRLKGLAKQPRKYRWLELEFPTQNWYSWVLHDFECLGVHRHLLLEDGEVNIDGFAKLLCKLVGSGGPRWKKRWKFRKITWRDSNSFATLGYCIYHIYIYIYAYTYQIGVYLHIFM